MNPSTASTKPRIAIVYAGDRQARAAADPGRFKPVIEALDSAGMAAEVAVYNDDFADEVREQLLEVDGVLVWVNPIVEDGRDRTLLDSMLRDVAAAGVFVSAHPDIILKIGTKDVLYATRNLGWGCDAHVYRSARQLRDELPARLAAGARVLKQYRGHSGNGVWKVEAAGSERVRARHAKRGEVERILPIEEFFAVCEPYFARDGHIIEQQWQPRIVEGMTRCYLVHDRVEGFGHQAINALHPGEPQPGPRLYHPPSQAEFQPLRKRLETEWLPAMLRLLGIDAGDLPVLWDCDFMLGPREPSGEERYLLCEINVSSVHPFPESALAPLARATWAKLRR
jgi:hypothetical protein